MPLSVQLIDETSQLTDALIGCWNQLSHNPLTRWEWLGSWWEAYSSPGKSLFVLVVRRGEDVLAIAPWHMDHHVTRGRQICFLGSGKACTDHLSLLVNEEHVDAAAEAIANWLAEHVEDWDQLELVGVDRPDRAIDSLSSRLTDRGLQPETVAGVGCYAIDLPNHWEDYVHMRSKSGRRETRQSYNNVASGILETHRVLSETDLNERWGQFVDLHQARRATSNSVGCFEDPKFETFLRSAAERLLKADMLELVVATREGVPVAAHFALVDKENWYFYQSGMNPNHASLRPGHSVFCYAMCEAISRGHRCLDMMRGDEPYKQRWRATERPTQELRVFSSSASSKVRQQIRNVGKSLKDIVKVGLSMPQVPGLVNGSQR